MITIFPSTYAVRIHFGKMNIYYYNKNIRCEHEKLLSEYYLKELFAIKFSKIIRRYRDYIFIK
jgi:hypothetical protein